MTDCGDCIDTPSVRHDSVRMLIIGYGNELCGDDAAGRVIADGVAQWHFPGVSTISTHQLTPDLAFDVANAERVLFIDATVAAGHEDRSTLTSVRGVCSQGPMSHQVEPATILSMARLLYESTPQAWMLTVPGEAFEIGDALSVKGEANIQAALALVRSWLDGASGLAASHLPDA